MKPTGGISVFLNFVSVGITNAINLITRYNTSGINLMELLEIKVNTRWKHDTR
jgi:hypothetical protein